MTVVIIRCSGRPEGEIGTNGTVGSKGNGFGNGQPFVVQSCEVKSEYMRGKGRKENGNDTVKPINKIDDRST